MLRAPDKMRCVPVLDWERYALLAILILAAVLRIIGLNADLWYDEVLTLLNYSRLPADTLAVTFGSLNNHILYSWLSKAAISLFGESAWAMRLPAMLFGIGSIWATWRLVREFAPRHIALLTALLLAVSYHHVWFSQNARGYTGLMFFTTLSSWILFRAVDQRQPTNRLWIGYALCVFAGLATHLSAAFFFLAQGLVVCIAHALRWPAERAWKPLAAYVVACLGGLALTFLLLAPLVPDVVQSISAVRAEGVADSDLATTDIKAWRNPIWTLLETLRSFGLIGAALPLAFGFAVYGGWRISRRAAVTVSTYALAFALTWLILISLSFRIWPRYFFHEIGMLIAFCVVGAFALADAVGSIMNKVTETDAWPRRLKYIGSGCLVAASVVLSLPNYKAPKQDVSGAIAMVDAANTTGAPVVTLGLSSVLFSDHAAPDWPHLESAAELETTLSASGEVWLVTAFPGHFETKFPEAFALANRHGSMEGPHRLSGTLGGGAIEVWHLKRDTDD